MIRILAAIVVAFIIGLIAGATLTRGAEASRPAPVTGFVPFPSLAATPVPSAVATVGPVALPIPPRPPIVSQHAVARTRPAATPAAHAALRGVASWGDGWTGVVTRLPRGTAIRVCGPLGCWSGRSVGYGPAARTGRVADLSRAVFARICGSPSMGLCPVTVTR